MNLFEYEAKAIAEKFNISIPKGFLVSKPEEAREAFLNLRKPAVIKAQVLVTGRAKAGGVKFASTPDEAYEISRSLLGAEIKGEKVSSLIIEEKVPAKAERYIGVAVDRSECCYAILASTEGGVDIEEVAEKHPHKIVKYNLDPTSRLRAYEAREIALALGYRGEMLLCLSSIIMKLFEIATVYDCELLEVNPLIETFNGAFTAADIRMTIDDNALYRHPDFQERMQTRLKPLERKAREEGLSYVELDGDIGVIGNGAGLVMATLDMIKYCGGKPANFCDVGGGASAGKMAAAIRLALSNERVKVLLINILGGITKCDEVARGILEVKDAVCMKPVIVRMVGTNDEFGRAVLAKEGISSLDSMEEAAKMAVKKSFEVK